MPKQGSINRGVVRIAVLLACLGVALVVAAAAGASRVKAAASTPVNASARVTAVPGTAAQPTSTTTHDLGLAPATATMTTDVFLSGQSAALAAFATSVSTPGSDDYQHFLTPAQAQARFGATPAQAAAVEQWLSSNGLSVTRISPQEISATGTVGQTDATFGTTLARYSSATGDFTAPSRPASLPAGVAGSVLSVVGLSTRQAMMRPSALAAAQSPAAGQGADASVPMSTEPNATPYLDPMTCSSYYGQLIDTTDPLFKNAHQPYVTCGYVPSQMRSAYGVTGGNGGQGVTVAILDAYESPTLKADANAYATNRGDSPFASGQFTQTVTPASWTDTGPCDQSGWNSEQSLDVEAVHAMAPNAKVAYFGANSCTDSDFLAAFANIINNHLADVISDSWGQPIYWSSGGSLSSATMDAYTNLFETAATEGIEITFSTGDCGAEDPGTSCGSADGSSKPQPDFPDSDAWVTAVGGTSVEIGQAGTVEQAVPWGNDYSILSGSTWVDQGYRSGGGGGTSYTIGQPFYQTGVVPPSLAKAELDGSTATSPMRVVPDLSLDANPDTGFLIGLTQILPDGTSAYAEQYIGGTSLASPLFAGLVADGISDAALARGFLNPTLYSVYSKDGSRLFDDVVDPAAGANPAEMLAPYNGRPVEAVTLGSDLPLTATTGYDNATGLGMPTPNFLSLGATTTALTSSQNPAVAGTPVTFTATVAATSATGTPVGSVQFYADGSPLGAAVPLSSGAATSAPVSTLAAGNHAITAAYTGDSAVGFLPSTSSALQEVVNVPVTSTTAMTTTTSTPSSTSVTPAGSGTPADGAAALPLSTTLGSANHTASVTLRCVATTVCHATATLYARSGKPLGSSDFELAAGKAHTAEIRLNRTGQKLTAGRKPIGGRLAVTSTSSTTASQTHSYAVTIKPLKQSLLAAVPHAGSAHAAGALTTRKYRLKFDALFAGRLKITWYVPGSGKQLKKVATGTAAFATAGSQPLTIKLGSAALLKHASHLIAKVTFTPQGEHAVSTSKRFRF
jgi:subtilase family serine protease